MGPTHLELSSLVFAVWLSGIGFAQDPTLKLPQTWSYADQTAWPAMVDSRCGARGSQSPIDIDLSTTHVNNCTLDRSLQGTRLGPASWILSQSAVNVTLHTGPVTWTVKVSPPFKEQLEWQGELFQLVSITFKSPSEHTVDGVHADLEVQLNHLSQTIYADGQRRLVAAIRFVAAKEVERHLWLSSVWKVAMAQFNSSEVIPFLLGNPYAELIPPDHSFIAYFGSTTVPPCFPAHWLVHMQTVPMSFDELGEFRASIGSYRPSRLRPGAPDTSNLTESEDNAFGFNNRNTQETGSRVLRLYRMTNVAQNEAASLPDVELHDSNPFLEQVSWCLLAIVAAMCLIYACCGLSAGLRDRNASNGEDSEDHMESPYGPQSNKRLVLHAQMSQPGLPPGPHYPPFPETHTHLVPPRGGYGHAEQTYLGY